jgi:hypothetical protein
VPVWGVCGVGVVVAWASASSDVINSVGAAAKLNAASPRKEKAFRRESISVSLFSLTLDLPILIVAITVVWTCHHNPTAALFSPLRLHKAIGCECR